MEAFAHAVSLGYRYLETDVHLSVDGALVAFHDANLRRACGIDRKICDVATAELAEMRVGGRAPVPLLNDLFDRFEEARFNIDCKSDAAVEPLARFIHERQAIDRVCLGSFSHARLRRLRSLLGPGLLTCMSPIEISSLRASGRLGGSAARVAQVPVRYGSSGRGRGVTVLTPRFVEAAHRQGIAVHVWTIDDPTEMERLLDLEVDGIMTDDPGTLRSVLAARGQWPES